MGGEVSGLLGVLLIVTVICWSRQDFSFSNPGPFNPVLYGGFGLLALGSIAMGMAKTLTIIRAEISARP